MALQSLDITARSATTTPSPGVRETQKVAKLIDVSKCIGCKACQVACMECNDLRDEIGTNHGVYDNPLDLTDKSWTVMRFSEVEVEKDKLEWLIRKDGCMHCADPGCLKAAPRRARSCSTATASWTFTRRTASAAVTVLPVARSISPESPRRTTRRINARCAPTGCRWEWNRPASRPAPPARSCSAPRRT